MHDDAIHGDAAPRGRCTSKVQPTLNETLIAVAGDRVARLVTGNQG
jgi:hypothetical protein